MTSTDPDMAPGDEVPPDTPSAGPVPCEHCQGRGKHDDGSACPECVQITAVRRPLSSSSR